MNAEFDLRHWCADSATNHRYYEDRELPAYDDRDTAIVEWTVRCLGNPKLGGARNAIAAIAERHGLDLAPTVKDQYLIWSHKQGAWWGPGAHGYRRDVVVAGRFTREQANDHANARSWPASQKRPPEVVIPAPPLDVLTDPERITDWLDAHVKAATEAKIAARRTTTP